MKKFFSVFAFMLIFPALFLIGCQKTVSTVDYSYITYQKQPVAGDLVNDYTFQVNVKNNTQNDVYITANSFGVVLTRNYGTHQKSANFSVYKNTVEEENKVEMSFLLQAGESQLLCIYIAHISTPDDVNGRLYSITLSHDGDVLKTIRID